MNNRNRKSGFTLIEILIVVIILGILAAIVIPQFTEASSDAKESSMVSNLQTLRSQMGLYKVQHDDQYPNTADGGVTIDADVANFISRLTSKTLITGAVDAANGEFGPYMPAVPENPFQNAAAAPLFRFGANPGADTAHWCFDPATGNIWADDDEVNSNGVAHSDRLKELSPVACISGLVAGLRFLLQAANLRVTQEKK